MSLLNVSGFRIWLEDEYGLKRKSAGDAVSRLNRALAIQDSKPELLLNKELDAFILNIKSNPQFLSLPDSSQAGILRALKLYKKYIS